MEKMTENNADFSNAFALMLDLSLYALAVIIWDPDMTD